ncbi:Maf family protein [Paenibacillus endoradicis]|uniref:Maf family protein n=1 Tax=Paenibacillus endoradicis TaxID=2972487 RepID=UPI00215997E1|nr:Maf family protein [Paenibacillus endoradicis]MCR8655702.1 Maf family protein [Paenibacillus endoradicis]MCR8658028.1 Maf family protein [Paenibacillus endoradicis]
MNERIMPYDYKSISRLVLASSSPRRKELVATLDLSLPVSVFSLDTDETIQTDWSPSDTVEQLSLAKATAVRQAILAGEAAEYSFDENSLILAADTIVLLDNDILGKPSSIEDAVTTLMRLQGREHQVLTGVTLLHTGTGETLVQHRVTHVKMRPLAEETIRSYVATGESSDKAGSYGIQGKGSILVDSITGCYFNVVGLPVSLVAEMLLHFDVLVLQ